MSKQIALSVGGIRIGDTFCITEEIEQLAMDNKQKIILIAGEFAAGAWRWQLDKTSLSDYVEDVFVLPEYMFPMDLLTIKYFYDAVRKTEYQERYDLRPIRGTIEGYRRKVVLKGNNLKRGQLPFIGVQPKTVSFWKNNDYLKNIVFPIPILSFEDHLDKSNGNFTYHPDNIVVRINDHCFGDVADMIVGCPMFVGPGSSLTLLATKISTPTVMFHFEESGIQRYGPSVYDNNSADVLCPSSEELQAAIDKVWKQTRWIY